MTLHTQETSYSLLSELHFITDERNYTIKIEIKQVYTQQSSSLFLNSYQIHELLANKCCYTNIFRRKFVLIEK